MTETQARAGNTAGTPGTSAEKGSEGSSSAGSKGSPGSPSGGGSAGGAGSSGTDATSKGGLGSLTSKGGVGSSSGIGSSGGGSGTKSGDGITGRTGATGTSKVVPAKVGTARVGTAKVGSGSTSSDDGSGHSAVGRATVPAGEKPGGGLGGIRYSRPAGMPPPPDTPARPGVATGPGSVAEPVTSIARTGPVRGGGATGTLSLGSLATGPVGSGSSGSSATGAARVTEAVRAARATVSAAAGRGPRRARLHVKRIDPWSVMKFSFAVSFVLFIVVIVATSVLYLALDAMGVFDSVNQALSEMVNATGDKSASSLKITAKGIIGGSALVGLVNVVLFTALATLSAFIYNVCADLVGGVELTLAEKD